MNYQEFKQQGNKVGALKRKLGISATDNLAPGEMISRLNKKKLSAKENVAIKGLI